MIKLYICMVVTVAATNTSKRQAAEYNACLRLMLLGPDYLLAVLHQAKLLMSWLTYMVDQPFLPLIILFTFC